MRSVEQRVSLPPRRSRPSDATVSAWRQPVGHACLKDHEEVGDKMPAPHPASPEPISRAPRRNVAESSPMLLASAGESVNRLEQLAALLGRDRLVTGRERVLYAVVHVVVEDLEGHHL